MNTIKIKEDDSKFIELSTDDAEILTCKQLLCPLNTEFSVFIFENFEKRFFKSEEIKTLFEIGLAYWKRYEKIPTETQMKAFLNNERYSDKKSSLLKNYNSIINFKEDDYDEKYVHDILIKFTKMRQIYFAMLDQFDDIEQKGDIGDCLARFEKIVQLDMISDLGTEYFSNLENHCNDLIAIDAREAFGFKELDKLTYGGLPTKNEACMVVIMAQPGLGKSQFMMNIAYNWTMKGKNVLVISLEMSEAMYSRRFDGLFADLNVNRLKENVGLLRLKVSQIKNNLTNTQLRIKEFPTGTCSASMIKQFLKKLKRSGFIPDLICVDYLNIMRPNSSNSSMGLYEKCARISEELRAISCELKLPIITAVQSNRCLLTSSIVNEKDRGKIQLKDVKIGDLLLSNNGKYNKVIKKYNIESSKTYKIITKSGKQIICTNIHEWPTSNGLKSILSGLKIGDKLIKRTLLGCAADKIGFFINKIKKVFIHEKF